MLYKCSRLQQQSRRDGKILSLDLVRDTDLNPSHLVSSNHGNDEIRDDKDDEEDNSQHLWSADCKHGTVQMPAC